MKLAMQLTLAGLVGALRSRAHGLADRIEAGYRPDIAAIRNVRSNRKPEAGRDRREDRDEVSRA